MYMNNKLASAWKRSIAILLDIFFILVLTAILLIFLALLVRFTDIKFLENLFLDLFENGLKESYTPKLFDYTLFSSILIYSGFPYSFSGNTLGRNLLGLKVLHKNGNEVNKWLLPYRFLLTFICFIRPILFLIYIIISGVTLLSKNRRSLSDYIFNTIVVENK